MAICRSYTCEATFHLQYKPLLLYFHNPWASRISSQTAQQNYQPTRFLVESPLTRNTNIGHVPQTRGNTVNTKEIETNTKLPKLWIDIKLHVIYLKPWNINNTRMIITSCVAEVSQSLNTLLPHCAGAKVLKNGCLSRTCQDRSEPKGNNSYLHSQTHISFIFKLS